MIKIQCSVMASYRYILDRLQEQKHFIKLFESLSEGPVEKRTNIYVPIRTDSKRHYIKEINDVNVISYAAELLLPTWVPFNVSYPHVDTLRTIS